MPSASIRSKVNGINPITGASRDDLVVADVVLVESANVHTTYSWTLAFRPAGSTAAFSGSVTASSPGTFTVDKEGPYLVRLTADLGTGTESTQYVRLRYLTVFGDLKLVAAGEGYGGAIPVPVDIGTTGWTDQQNFNLQTILGYVARVSASGRVFYVDANAGTEGYGDYSSVQDAIDAAVLAGAGVATPYVVLVRPGIYTEDLAFAPFVHVVGWPGNPSGTDNQRAVILRGTHTAAMAVVSDVVIVASLLLENIVLGVDPVVQKDGPGTAIFYRANLEQNGLGAAQGAALHVDRGTVLLDSCEVVAHPSLPDTRPAIIQSGSSPSTATVRRTVVRGPTGMVLNSLFGPDVVTEVVDSRVVSTGATGVSIVSDAESLLLEYARVESSSGDVLQVHPGAAVYAGDVAVTVRWSFLAGPVEFDTTGIGGTTSLQVGSSEYTSFVFPGGTPGTLAATTKSTSLFYDNTLSGLTAENVQDAIDEVMTLVNLVTTLDDAYDGGIPASGSGRTIIADAGSVQVTDAPVSSDPPPAGNTNGRLEAVGGVRVGALGFPEIDADPNPYGSGPTILMGSRVVPNNIPFGAGTAMVMGQSTGTPLFRNYNLRVQTQSSTGGGQVGRLILQGGEGLDNGAVTPDAASVYVQAGSAFDVTAEPGSVFVAPGRRTGGAPGSIVLVRPDGSTPATLTAAGACADPIGVTGAISFATNMGAVKASLLAADTRAMVVAKLDALEGISAVEALGVITLTTDHEGPNAEVYFLSASAGVDAAIGGFDGQAQVDGTYGDFIVVEVTADQEVSIGVGGAVGPLVYNADTGKLTVPGLLDPTAVVFEEAAAPATGATEGALFVSDGSGGLTLGNVYFRGPANAVPQDLTTASVPEDLFTTLTAGNFTGGVHVVLTSGDEVRGQSAAGVAGDVVLRGGSDTGAGPTDGGDVAAYPGLGVGGGVDGVHRLWDAAGANSVALVVTGAEEVEIGTTLPMVYNGVTGKLTVPGVIDPVAVVLTESTAPTTGAAEGGLFVFGNTFGAAQNRPAYRFASGGSTVQIRTGGRKGLAAVAFPYLLLDDDDVLAVLDTAAPRTITLDGEFSSREVTITDESGGAGANNITIAGGGANISGNPSYTIGANYGSVTLYSDGTDWFVKSNYP